MIGSANRKSAKFHICKRSEKHQIDLRFSELIFGPLIFENYQVSYWNLLQCWTNVLHHEIFLKRCFWSGIFWCHFVRNFFTWKRMQKGNLSKINPALIGIDTSDLGYGELRERIFILRKIQGPRPPPPPLQNVNFLLHVTKNSTKTSVGFKCQSQPVICKGLKHGGSRDGPWIFPAIHVISVNFKQFFTLTVGIKMANSKFCL